MSERNKQTKRLTKVRIELVWMREVERSRRDGAQDIYKIIGNTEYGIHVACSM